MPLAVTLFRDRAASTAERHSLSLRQLASRAEQTRAAEKAALPLLKLATFGEQRTPRGSLRSNANVEAVSGIEADYDAGVMRMSDAADKLRAAGAAALLYTSPSHTPAAPRWRVLCPVTEPRNPSDRADLVARLNGLLDGVLAPESFTLSQTFYIGGVGQMPDTMLVDGAPLDDLLDLPAVYPAKRVAEPLPLPVHVPGQEPDAYVREARGKALAAFEASDNRHMTLLAVTATLAPFVLSGHLNRDELVSEIQDAMSASGRDANPAEVEGALDGVLGLPDLRPYHPPSDGSEFPPLPPLLATVAGHRRILTPDECDGVTARPYRVKGLLAQGDVACLFGPPGAGKSLLAPFLAYRMAQGAPFFGLRTRQGSALYVAAEDETGMRRRVHALRLAHGDAPGFGLVAGVSDLNPGTGDLAWLLGEVSERLPALVVVDTLAMAWPGLVENDADGMGRVVGVARRLASHGAAVLLVHHDTKARDGTPRGHSLLNGALDVAVALDPADGNGIIRGRLTKNRNGPCTHEMAFRIGVARLGTDGDGDPITAAHALELANDAVPARAAHLSPAEAAAVALLSVDGSPMAETEWLQACATRSSAQTPKDQGRSARALRTKLLDKQIVQVSGGMIRRVQGDQAGPEAFGFGTLPIPGG